MRVLLLITSLVALASAGGVPQEMAERLMELSLLHDCWGEGNMAGYYKMVKDAADKCHLMESTVTVADLFGPVSALFWRINFLSHLTCQQRPIAST